MVPTAFKPHPHRPEQLLSIDRRVYAIGDVHGRQDCLDALLTAIDEDIARHPIAETYEVYLGDFVDRGPQSKDVIQTLVDRKASHHITCLIGNHDYALMSMLTDDLDHTLFLANGGAATCLSYGINPTLHRSDLVQALQTTVPQAHQGFLKELQFSARIDNLLFVHAGVRPGVPLDQQAHEDLLYIRKPFLMDDSWHGALVILGHSPARAVQFQSNRIGIDTGAFMSGVLTAAVLETNGVRLLQATCLPNKAFGTLKQ